MLTSAIFGIFSSDFKQTLSFSGDCTKTDGVAGGMSRISARDLSLLTLQVAKRKKFFITDEF